MLQRNMAGWLGLASLGWLGCGLAWMLRRARAGRCTGASRVESVASGWPTNGRLWQMNGIDAEAGPADTLITPGAAWVDEGNGNMTHAVVDTEAGLKIVVNNARNFFNSNYAVQFCGTLEQCQAELKRLRSM